jgi:hypothetical protein
LEDGNSTMLVWLGKQYLGQRDKNELTGADGRDLVVRLVRFSDVDDNASG